MNNKTKIDGDYIAELILHMFWPNRCRLCNKIINPHSLLCENCGKDIRFVPHKVCSMIIPETGSKVALAAAAFNYGGNSGGGEKVRRLLVGLKQRNDSRCAKYFGKAVARTVSYVMNGVSFDAVCFVPMHRKRQRTRGHNQSEMIACYAAKSLGVQLVPILMQTKISRSQHTLGADERFRNVSGIYYAEKLPDNIKTVLIIDDIITTGATAISCAAALADAGAEEIYFAAAAETYDEK